MRVLLDFQHFGIHLELFDYRYETDCYDYFALSIQVKRHVFEVAVFKHCSKNDLLFCIDLPFFHLRNDMVREAVSTGTNPMYYVRPVITGKVFGHTIDRSGMQQDLPS